ncbi:hypothetical protein DB346_24165 [Verrucomicrobia bacterium LW23]|nr:hypothetical protein DB346_24165 [Verrucomicrobia bacterium LW23]
MNLDSSTVVEFVRGYVSRYGTLNKFEIDRDNKSLIIDVTLNGEDNDIHVHIKKYEVVETNGKLSILIHDVETSREWVNKLAENKKFHRPIPVPEKYAQTVRNLL